jgi:hypothetical protein
MIDMIVWTNDIYMIINPMIKYGRPMILWMTFFFTFNSSHMGYTHISISPKQNRDNEAKHMCFADASCRVLLRKVH